MAKKKKAPTRRDKHMVEYKFKDGVMIGPTGRRYYPDKVKATTASNGYSTYFTTLWTNGVVTCDCRGWTIRKKNPDGTPKMRTCKHCDASRNCNFTDMTDADAFRAAASAADAPVRGGQIDLNVRQPRRIKIRKKRQDV